jgi:hypothetical protein
MAPTRLSRPAVRALAAVERLWAVAVRRLLPLLSVRLLAPARQLPALAAVRLPVVPGAEVRASPVALRERRHWRAPVQPGPPFARLLSTVV